MFQDVITAYRNPDQASGKKSLQSIIESNSSGAPAVLVGLRWLGRTLEKAGCRCLVVFRPVEDVERSDGGIELRAGTSARSSAGVPESHPLHRS